MAFLIAAAGTGGHVFPGLAVGEALMELGVGRDDIIYAGGDRLEATVYPGEGFRFLQVELAGLKRSLTIENARIPLVVWRARNRIGDEIGTSSVQVVLGMGGYATIPAALAARKKGVAFFNAEQNAEAGLANRLTARWAEESFVAFPDTVGLERGTWVGNPLRMPFWSFERSALRPIGLERYRLGTGSPIVGVVGGSLGAQSINEAVAGMIRDWGGPRVQFIHLTGEGHLDSLETLEPAPDAVWRRIGFEERMEVFYAICDLVIARAGGAVAELTATGTPSILVPGQFGSGSHQEGNARYLASAGAALVIEQGDLRELSASVIGLMTNADRLLAMAKAARDIAKPDAALTIARTMIAAAR